MKRPLALLVVMMVCASCFPYTSVPMAVMMGVDSAGKRDRLEEYAGKGDVYAMYDLAESYRRQPYQGVLNYEKAMEWYCKAGRGGHAKAQYELGLIYEGAKDAMKIEIEPDLGRAYMWYKLGARRMNNPAIDAWRRLNKTIDEKGKARGEMLLTEWKQVPCGIAEKDNPMPKARKKQKKKAAPKKEEPMLEKPEGN